MSTFTPFGACVEHLCLSHANVADMLSEVAGKPYSLHRAKMVCEGREPVPGFAWSALRYLDRNLDDFSDQMLRLYKRSDMNRFIISRDDMSKVYMRRVLVRAILKLDGGEQVEVVERGGPIWGAVSITF